MWLVNQTLLSAKVPTGSCCPALTGRIGVTVGSYAVTQIQHRKMSFWSMKPLQLLITIPFWAMSRRLGRIILTWGAGNITTSPPHRLTDISVGPQCGMGGTTKTQIMQVIIWVFRVSSAMFHHGTHSASWVHCQAPQESWGPLCPEAESPRGSVAAQPGSQPCPAAPAAADGGCGRAERSPWSPWFHVSSETHQLSNIFVWTSLSASL